MSDPIAEIVKAHVDIYAYVSRFVMLKKSGAYYSGLSPFKTERTPSFTVTPRLGIYKCFSTGKSGDVISFCQEMEGLSYHEALRRLAQLAGVKLPESGPVAPPITEAIAALNDYAALFFKKRLMESPEAVAFLKQRGITGETAKAFKLGYAPEPGVLPFAVIAKQNHYSDEALVTSSLAKRREEDGHLFDFFRNRVMFPIFSPTGKIAGFAGRSLASAKPKYLNTSNSPLYNKSQTLYGLYHSREGIRQQKSVIVVEGYMDVLMCHQHGITNVVAVSGTAFTVEQAKIIQQYAGRITFLFDGDEAGRNAASKAVITALQAGIECYVCLMPDPYDPDEFLQAYGKEALLMLLNEDSKPGLVHIASLINAITDPATKAENINLWIDNFSTIEDRSVREISIEWLAKEVGADVKDCMRRDYRTQYRKKHPVNILLPDLDVTDPGKPTLEETLLAYCIEHWLCFDFVAANHSANVFADPQVREAFQRMVNKEQPAVIPESPLEYRLSLITVPGSDTALNDCITMLYQQRGRFLQRLQAETTADIYASTTPQQREKLLSTLHKINEAQKTWATTTAEKMFTIPTV